MIYDEQCSQLVVHHSGSNLEYWAKEGSEERKKRIHIMEFTRKFIYLSLLSVIALFALQSTLVHSYVSNIGFCSNLSWMMTKIVHKQNDKWFKNWFGRKTDKTVRFPEVIKTLDEKYAPCPNKKHLSNFHYFVFCSFI